MLLDDDDDVNDARCYTPKDLSVMNVLKYPVWVFDIERRQMYWGNRAALTVWNAPSLEALVQRDFSTNTPETNAFLDDLLTKFRDHNESITESWTFYPQGKGAITMGITCSGIRIGDGRLAMLVEGELPDNRLVDNAVRGMEFLRRLPFSVVHFSIEGNLVYQNIAAVDQYGPTVATQKNPRGGDFLSRFVDQEVGKAALKQVQEGTDFFAETKQHTQQGPRWFSVNARRTKDPVTSRYVILFSARDISDIVMARKETSRAASKSEFMAVMGHEIRTPLHQMIGYLDLLETSNLVPDQKDYLKQIQSSSSLLMSIINDLLEYSKLECGHVRIEKVDFGLEGLIDGLIACVQPGADHKLLTLQCTLADNVPRKLMGDPNRLRQVLLNLLSNSVKFTNNKGSVAVNVTLARADEKQQRIRFEVTDTGIGIDPSVQHLIFEKYRQADPSISRHYGGTGLGLAICKGLAELMGGFIGCSSELGKGTTMFFEIPLHLPSLKVMQPCDSIQTVTIISDTRRKLRILVVEDNKINQKMMYRMLEQLGHYVALAGNGRVAVDLIERESFDLVLMDVQMPVMDGIECTKHIRTILRIDKATLPVVGLSASFQKEELKFYEDLGMNDCLGKPLRLEQLKQAISTLT